MKLTTSRVIKWKTFLKYLQEEKKTIPVVVTEHFTDKVILTCNKNQGNYLKFSCPSMMKVTS